MCNVHTAHPLSRNPGIPQGLISGISQGLTVEPGIPQGFMFLRLEFLRGSGFSSWNSSEVQVFEAGIPQGGYSSRTCILDRGCADIKWNSPISDRHTGTFWWEILNENNRYVCWKNPNNYMYRNITVSLLKSNLSKFVIHVKECLTGVNMKQNEHEVQIEVQYKQQHLTTK